MKWFTYPVKVVQEGNAKVLSCRDIPEANAFTYDDDIKEQAKEMLYTAIEYYFKKKIIIPAASKPRKGEVLVSLEPTFVLKIILHNSMLENGVRQADIAKKLDVPTSEVARIVDYKRKTKIDTMATAIQAAGSELQLVY